MMSIQIFNQDTSKDQSAWKIFQLTEILKGFIQTICKFCVKVNKSKNTDHLVSKKCW